jgi:hypothetical protein
MSGNNRSDCFREKSVEERLAERALREEVVDLRVQSYRTVEEYDPVLRSHCRLEEDAGKESDP